MIETIAIISNGIVVLAIGVLYRKVSNQEKSLNAHMIQYTEAITERPTFNQFRSELKELKTDQCKKVSKVEVAFLRHVHEGSAAKVVL